LEKKRIPGLSDFALELLALHWSFVDEGFSVVVKRITEKKKMAAMLCRERKKNGWRKKNGRVG
jgi:hypothetical protein